MKTFRLLLLLFFIPVTFHAQKTLTGLWTGILSNDTTTARKDQSFEIALTQYKEKVYGYSRSTFIVNDTLYYILKRVKGTINGDICEVKDDEILSYNFRGKIDKGIKVTTTFQMNRQDSSWYLAGKWTTNQTKRFYSIKGKVDLKDEPDMAKSKIFPHLEELDLAKEIPFYVETKKAAAEAETKSIALNNRRDLPVKNKVGGTVTKKDDIAVATIASRTRTEESKPAAILKSNEETKKPVETAATAPEPKRAEPLAVNKTEVKKEIPAETMVAKTEPKKPEAVVITTAEVKKEKPAETIAVNNPEVKKEKTAEAKIAIPESKKTEPIVVTRPEVRKEKPAETTVVKPEPKISEPVAVNKPVEEKNKPTTQAVIPENKKQEVPAAIVSAEPKKTEPIPVAVTKPPAIGAALVNERKTSAPQEVLFASDSLELTLYDNGEIDGDTVSVLMNGEIILAKQGLKSSAIKKTIYIQPGDNEFILVLYAENLGKYPPNTGLLVVHDGEERYQVRFSADLQQNASVIFHRRRK